jgi:hypothetical protein
MTPQTPDMQAILERLKKLEGQNRRLKRAGVLSLVAVGMLVLMGQATPKSQTIRAEKFVLIDTEGRARAEIAMLHGGPALRFFGPSEEVQALFGGTGLSLFKRHTAVASLSVSDLSFFTDKGKVVLLLGGGRPGDMNSQPDLVLYGPDGQPQISLLGAESGPSLSLSDAVGFKSVLGSAELETVRTGETHQTSAASLAMFDKDGKVIWRAP